jgi:hypothetical protein
MGYLGAYGTLLCYRFSKNSYRNIECDGAGGLRGDNRVEGVGAGDCAPGSDHHHSRALPVHI